MVAHDSFQDFDALTECLELFWCQIVRVKRIKTLELALERMWVKVVFVEGLEVGSELLVNGFH